MSDNIDKLILEVIISYINARRVVTYINYTNETASGVQQKGRFKVTSEGVDLDKVIQLFYIRGFH